MSRRVFVHIGLPKTGTSYLQAILWPARHRLRQAGLLLPGARKNDHLFASMVVREDPGVHRRGPGAEHAWDRVRADVADFDGDSLISHEFFCSATEEQARTMVAQLAPAEVHVVVTAREPLGLFTSSWQESLKNMSTTPLSDYGRSVSSDPRDVWDWRALDLGLVLDRWTPAVGAERVHVIAPGPSGSPRTLLWERFCSVVGLAPDIADPSTGFANSSMGVVEAETLRRINLVLPAYNARDRGRWLRSFLADQRLVPRGGEPFRPDDQQVADCRARGEAAVRRLREAPYDVVGDAALLLVPDELPERRHPGSVTEAEVAQVAVELVARLMDDVRGRPDGPGPGPGGLGRASVAAAPARSGRWRARVRAARRRLGTRRRPRGGT